MLKVVGFLEGALTGFFPQGKLMGVRYGPTVMMVHTIGVAQPALAGKS